MSFRTSQVVKLLSRSRILSSKGNRFYHASNVFLKGKQNEGNFGPGWVTIKMSKDGSSEIEDRPNHPQSNSHSSEMTEFTLSDAEADDINQRLGIDKEIKELRKQSKPKQKADILKASKSNPSELTAPQNSQFRAFLELNPLICSGCGSPFQSRTPDAPGYLPQDKFVDHREKSEFIRKKQKAIKILEMADFEIDHPAAERFLVTSGVEREVIDSIIEMAHNLKVKEASISNEVDEVKGFSIPIEDIKLEAQDKLEEFTDDEDFLKFKKKEKNDYNCICQRCYRLQSYGQIDEKLRPGWSDNEFLTPERFETLLGSIKSTESVVLCLVDIFDLQGSVIKNLKQIVGSNPLIVAVNKIDLLPTDISKSRVSKWIYDEIRDRCGFISPREAKELPPRKNPESGVLRPENIHLISCSNNHGIDNLMKSAISLAAENGRKIHVMGVANVGKSSFINKILNPVENKKTHKSVLPKYSQPLATVSNLPGTTLDFLKIKLPNGMLVVDTPGLIVHDHLTSKLTTQELKQVIPSKPINAITLRLDAGSSILLGGLARVEMLEGMPFFFTFFVSNEIKIHKTRIEKADNFIQTHMGKLIFPPESYERYEQLGPYESTIFDIQGEGWSQAAEDIVIPGLGWVSLTGSGSVKVKVTVPEKTHLSVRPALLPYEAKYSTAKFTGTRLSKKSGKSGSSYGWRA